MAYTLHAFVVRIVNTNRNPDSKNDFNEVGEISALAKFFEHLVIVYVAFVTDQNCNNSIREC